MLTQSAVELAARTSYGRLVAYLSSRTGDIASAEDALGEAFVSALTLWPTRGVPQKPEAWLLTVARRRLLDDFRHQKVAANAAVDLGNAVTETQKYLAQAEQEAVLENDFPDERLKMLFLCAHPAIDAAVRTPLLLQAVLGLDAALIASAFLVAPATMSQRLVRAKTKIRAAKIRFETPDEHELPARVGFVLESIYAAYGAGWEDVGGAQPQRKDLTNEAIYLGQLLVQKMPDEPEAYGLLALMLYCESRHEARRDALGAFVPLGEQDVSLWSKPLIGKAESLLQRAAIIGRPGRFQWEAAIQSAHTQRLVGTVDWKIIVRLYESLVSTTPTVGAMVGLAAARAEAGGAEAGLTVLRSLPRESVLTYQPYWALNAHLLRRTGQNDAAKAAFTRAIGLCSDAATREYLQRQSSEPMP